MLGGGGGSHLNGSGLTGVAISHTSSPGRGVLSTKVYPGTCS